MPPKFSAALATADDWSSSNAGMGRTKQNDKNPNDLNVNFTGPEWNQQNLEIVAAQTKIGVDDHEPVGVSATVDRSHDYILEHLIHRYDRPGFIDTGTLSKQFMDDWNGLAVTDRESLYLDTIAGAAAQGMTYISATNLAIGTVYVTLNAAVQGGWTQLDGIPAAVAMWYFRATRFAARVQIDALPATNGDLINIGLYRDATNYVMFHSTRAGGAWPNWTVEVNDGGASWSDTLVTGNPSDIVGAWFTFEIRTTASGAYFYYNRAQTTAEYFGPGSQAPDVGQCRPWIVMTSNVGGESLRRSTCAVMDTRNLFGN